MSTRLASCSCGQLQAQVTGEPVRISICHCLECQRRTGSPFAQQARFPAANVTVSGQSNQYSRVGDAGSRATFHFCPQCSSIVYYEATGLEAYRTIPVGAFADPGFPAPTVSVYEGRKHGWVVPPADADTDRNGNGFVCAKINQNPHAGLVVVDDARARHLPPI